MAEKKIDQNSVFIINQAKLGSKLILQIILYLKWLFLIAKELFSQQKQKRKTGITILTIIIHRRFTNNLKNYYESEAYSIDDSTGGYRWIMDK